MSQFPSFVAKFPSPTLIPTSVMLPLWPHSQSNEDILAVDELKYQELLRKIRKFNSNLIVIGKGLDQKEDADTEDEDPDNIEESDGDEFDQEIG
ncbi:hypothetical protein ZOSMA_5G02930 [Zostera marina]|uniref:Uncharacterized protein n=1 Tax=Zostera marina TaxID=29655 RepID=A0A0K9NWR3_ZOSMR|nr:hypothetical protein ZOSMA_5G02930 [Zostera marina]